MSFNDIINTKLNNYPNFYQNNKTILYNDYELSSDDDINISKSKDENYIINLDTELKTSIKEDRNNISNSISNEFKITKFNFFIYNHNQEENSNNIKNTNNITKENNNIKPAKKRGRKGRRDIAKDNKQNKVKENKIHNKYSDDNIRKKCKNIILKYALKFINTKIKEIYKENIGYGRLNKQLKILKQDNKIKSTVDIDKLYFEKILKEIFSEDISKRFNNFLPNHNKKLIESLINDKDDEKSKYFKSLFNLSFLNCLNVFVGKEYIEELDGFTTFESIKDDLIKKHGKNYVDLMEYYFNNFKEIINNKKARKSKKRKDISLEQ